MVDQFLRSFLKTGDIYEAYGALSACFSQKRYQVGMILSEHFLTLFPDNFQLLLERAKFAYNIQEYDLSFSICDKLLQMNLTEKLARLVLIEQKKCNDFVADRYTFYNEEKVREIMKRQKNAFPLLTFTVTTCKRLDLFEKTMNSFINCCRDLHLIDTWFCVDDNSSDEDRHKMQKLYPFFHFYFKTQDEKGHPQSMNIILNNVNTPYIFHIEDDWKFFVVRDYLTSCFDIITQSPNIGQCLINQNYIETTSDLLKIVGGVFNVTQKGIRYYLHEHCPDLESQEIFNKKYQGQPNCAYWPHFSFRPSLVRTAILNKLGKYNEKVSHFEMEYSRRYRDSGYVSAFMEGLYCIHIGRLTSERYDETKMNAYSLNNEKQFSGKEEKKGFSIRTFVVNLDRRQDRWEKCSKQNDIKFLQYERFSAIDGSKLVPTEQLQRIFDGNDYDMREGMVGCAMSHIKLYIDLINSKYDAYCIFEDDLEFTPNFKDKFMTVMNLLLSQEKDWDICYLGHHLWKKYRTPDEYDKEATPILVKRDTKSSLQFSMGGTGGYLISKKGALALLEFINKNGMTNGIDTMQQKSANELNVYYCKPHLIYSDCWEPDANSIDTDIQTNFRSLTIPVSDRYEQEKKFYSEFSPIFTNSEEEIQTYITDKQHTKVTFYTGSNISTLLQMSVHPCYSLNYQIMIVVPKPNETVKSKRYFDRLKKKGVFDITDALENVQKKFIAFSEMRHVWEAIQTIQKSQKYPFDQTDGGNFETFALLSELCLEMDDDQIKDFVSSFFDPSKTRKENGILVSKLYNIAFPHDKPDNLISDYTERFKNLRDVIKSGNEVIFVYCTRWVTTSLQYMYYFLDLLHTYNRNVKLLVINGLDEKERIDDLHSSCIFREKVDFPEKLRYEGWDYEKVKYDQETFRPSLFLPIKKYAYTK